MKVFRQSFWKTTIGFPFAVGSVFSLLVIIPDGIAEGFSCSRMVKMLFIVYSFPFCMALYMGFCVVLFDDILFVKNTIFPFWKKKVYFKDITRVNIVDYGGNAIPYIQIITYEAKLAWRYYLDRVNRKDLPELVAILREKGIDVRSCLPESNLAFFVSKYSFLDACCMVMEPK